MNSSLDPIPTTQAVAIEASPSDYRQQVSGRSSQGRNLRKSIPSREGNGMAKAYPWLLATSVCLSGVLCWMYVTKPVIAQAASSDASASTVHQPSVSSASPSGEPSQPLSGAASLIPSDSALPGNEPTALVQNKESGTRQPGPPVSIDPRKLAAMSGDSSQAGWESTNLKVQHILSADSGNGQLEKIILDVPVRYQTRTMRWTSMDVEKARNVLGRLMVYERDLNNLRKQGELILRDWNTLMEHTVPAPALRADSPSIPYNQGYEHGALPDSSTVIQVDNAASDGSSNKSQQPKN